jgi:hypothetical protein
VVAKPGVKDTIEPSPSIAIPLIEAAINEDREGLKEIWAKLLAAAMDPSRANRVRQAFISAAKAMEPLDATVLLALAAIGWMGPGPEKRVEKLLETVKVSGDEISVSLDNLSGLRMADGQMMTLLPSGREFLRAIQDE